ncbi:MAG: Hsp20/alpha crystallin family protein [Acidobacteria bacterium]|nr:Hsp20/alpha crystallin family protein [Acidobacteriota bacterium]
MFLSKYNSNPTYPVPFRFFEEALNDLIQAPATSRPWAPSVDILETENELVVKADLPEVKLEDISIHLENGILSLKGERKFEHQEDKAGYHRLERGYGSFARNFAIPDTVDAEKVAAAFKDGVLTVTLPKKEIAKPRAIKVNVAR